MTRYLLTLLCLSCAPIDGTAGIPGPQGPPGPMGAMGSPGKDADGAANQDGNRLQVRYRSTGWTGADGTKIYQGTSASLFDSKLKVACGMRLADDGKLHCLPSAPEPSPYFLEATCKDEVVIGGRLAAACTGLQPPQPVYAAKRLPSMECESGQRLRIYAVGGEYPIPAAIYTLEGGKCTALGAAQYDTAIRAYRFYALGAPIPAAEFVEGTYFDTTTP